MIIQLQIGSEIFTVDTDHVQDVAIPLDFEGTQPNAHGIGRAVARTHAIPGILGNTVRGGSCNWCEYTFTPHSHGTHTECVGHITDETLSINKVLNFLLIPAVLVSTAPIKGSECKETYLPEKKSDDFLITQQALQEGLDSIPSDLCRGVLIRTLPNDAGKLSRDYEKTPSPFFSREAIEYLNYKGVEHLLVDFPSIDRLRDDGVMLNHHLFWNVALGSHDLGEAPSYKTITEWIYVPSAISDGVYALNLQIPCFIADAAPSRPLLYPMQKLVK